MQTDSLPIAETKPPKLRWFQYSLRSLFLLTTVVAIGMSWLTVTMQNQRKQKAAAEAIQKAQGDVSCEVTWLGRLLRDDSLVMVTRVDLSGEFTNDVWKFHFYGLKHLHGLSDILGAEVEVHGSGLVYPHELSHQDCSFRKTEVSDDVLVRLPGLAQLQDLDLRGAKVTDGGLVHLQGLSQLQNLELSGTKVADGGLVHLQGLRRLEGLGLDYTQVTDAGLVHLRGLSQLRLLTLGGTKVTDAGLVHVQGLSQLQELGLGDTNVTDQGIEKLQQALPKCKIYR
jgi:hypothetical protein